MAEQYWRANRPEVIDEHFEDEYVLVNLKTGTYYSLNPTAAVIWDGLGKNLSQRALLQKLEKMYRAESTQLAAALERLLGEMQSEQLIVPMPEPNATAVGDRAEEILERRAFTPPVLEKFTDMQALLLLDPIHQVDDTGWPSAKPHGG